MSRVAANAAGLGAILSWGTLGVLGKLSEATDTRLVFAACFAIAGLVGVVICLATGRSLAPQMSRRNVLFALLLSAYHLIYFASFSLAPALHVSLINYLWPALLILFGNLFFRLNSGWQGYAGVGLGFCGIVVLLLGGAQAGHSVDKVSGYVMALVGAALWAFFSNLRRTDTGDPIASMTVICALSAALCAVSIFIGSGAVGISNPDELIIIILLGLGPAGGAFFLWDMGMKRGNAAALAVFGYSAPILSTIFMVLAGFAEARWNTAVAALLIAAGGAVVSLAGSVHRRESA